MIGFVLAAGYGTRLRPLTEQVPKALVTVGGRTLLELAVERLATAGMSPLLVNCHYLAEQMRAAQAASGVAFDLVEEPVIRGTGGAMDQARGRLSAAESFAVLNVDILCDAPLEPLAAAFEASGALVGLVAEPSAARGTIMVGPDGGYRGVPVDRDLEADESWANFIGLAFYRREFLELVTADDFSVVPVWRRALEAGKRVAVLPLPEGTWWRDIGTSGALLGVHRDLLDGRCAIRPAAELRIDRERKICAPAGSSTEGLEAYAWVEEPVPPGCRIGESVVLRGARLRPGTRLRDRLLTPWGEMRIEA